MVVAKLPNHSFKNVVNDEMRLKDHQEQGHVSKGKLAKLKLVVALLKVAHKDNDSQDIETK